MTSGDDIAALVPVPRTEADPQVLLIRSLASDVTDRKITHAQAVAELRRQLVQSAAGPSGSSRSRGGVNPSGLKPVLSA